METGEKYLVLQIGDLKIPFFPKTSKAGQKYFQAQMNVYVNTVKDTSKPEVKKIEDEL